MTTTLDARGLNCPAPVLLAKDTIDRENPSQLVVIVDNPASRENVGRFLTSKNYVVTEQMEGKDFHLQAILDASPTTAQDATPAAVSAKPAKNAAGSQKIMVLISSDRFGRGDDELGEKLMQAYLKTIKEMGDDLWHLVFVNSGVKLTVKDSPVLTEIQEYEKQGVTVLACGTCLAHFDLIELKEVGQTTNMLDIVCATQLADKVVQVG